MKRLLLIVLCMLLLIGGCAHCCPKCRPVVILDNSYSQENLKKMDYLRMQTEASERQAEANERQAEASEE